MAADQWPRHLWIVRHGQSAGNVARDRAEAAGLPLIDIETRDVDTPLSTLGERQSVALGRWFGAMPADAQPTVVLTSPYLRARHTAELLREAARLPDERVEAIVDERLREKEFGILDRLTKFGIREKYPELDHQRRHVGKFYFRPPGGESWCDVILRLRSVLDTMAIDYPCERILVVAHQVIVNCFRYLFEHLDERTILEFDRAGDVPNCSVTSYVFDPALGRRGGMAPELLHFVAPLEETGTPVTEEPDVQAAPKP
ncbi:MAG: histidine phosphatase family protein [Burkholderiaceae bacterium]